MKIRIITFGKIKDSSIIELLNYYHKLASKYFHIEFLSLKDPGERKILLSDISEKLGEFNIVLTEQGSEKSSVELSNYIEKLKQSTSTITFIFGNAYGIENDVIQNSDFNFSLSRLTFPHEISYIVLLEQLFRAGSIASGSKYHK